MRAAVEGQITRMDTLEQLSMQSLPVLPLHYSSLCDLEIIQDWGQSKMEQEFVGLSCHLCLSVPLTVSVCLFVCLFTIYLFIYLFIHLFIYLFIFKVYNVSDKLSLNYSLI